MLAQLNKDEYILSELKEIKTLLRQLQKQMDSMAEKFCEQSSNIACSEAEQGPSEVSSVASQVGSQREIPKDPGDLCPQRKHPSPPVASDLPQVLAETFNMATPVTVLRLPRGPDPNSRGFDPKSPRFIALCRTSVPTSAASEADPEQLQREQHARSVLRESFLRCLLLMTNKKVQFNMYEKVKVEATFGASDIDVLNFQVSDLHTPIGVQKEALIREKYEQVLQLFKGHFNLPEDPLTLLDKTSSLRLIPIFYSSSLASSKSSHPSFFYYKLFALLYVVMVMGSAK
ncbi:hypothetical protein INR49_030638, partial [Caranx melampygus]